MVPLKYAFSEAGHKDATSSGEKRKEQSAKIVDTLSPHHLLIIYFVFTTLPPPSHKTSYKIGGFSHTLHSTP
jgi:hypothetical protein